MFIRNCWYVFGWSHEVVEHTLLARSIINEGIVVYRTEVGRLVALEDRCCHRFAPLSKGRLEGDNLRCMYHGLKFNPQGECIEIPGQEDIPARARVKTFPVVDRHSWIWVWMGNPELADEDLIPPAVGLDSTKWTLRYGHMDYKANYELINDNLTDFSHLSYVHANSFGIGEEVARTRPTVTRLPRGIRVQRWVVNALREGLDPEHVLAKNRDAGTVTWQSYDYLAPGVLIMVTETHTASAMPADRSPPTTPPVRASITSQAVTPTTDKTTRYFYSAGPLAGAGSEQVAEGLIKVSSMAFEEDREMIEAQQDVIDRDPGRRELLTSADVGPTQMRSIIREMLKVEQ